MCCRLIKALEDLFVPYDNPAQNASGGIVQLCYGDDGIDHAHMNEMGVNGDDGMDPI